MYKIKETIVVEGIYDKIKLSRFIDAVIIVTNGFCVFSDDRILESIKKMADETGIVILTDSDSAGFKIRNYIKQSLPKEKVKHAYVPDVHGKENARENPEKRVFWVLRGLKDDIILDSLKKAGCTIDGSATAVKAGCEITKADLYKAGLSGGDGSGEKRNALAHSLGIPMKISANMLLDLLNRLLNYDEFVKLYKTLTI